MARLSPTRAIFNDFISYRENNANETCFIFTTNIVNKHDLQMKLDIAMDNNIYIVDVICQGSNKIHLNYDEILFQTFVRKLDKKLNQYKCCDECNTLYDTYYHECDKIEEGVDEQLSYDRLKGNVTIRNVNGVCFGMNIGKESEDLVITCFACEKQLHGQNCRCSSDLVDSCEEKDEEGNLTCSYTLIMKITTEQQNNRNDNDNLMLLVTLVGDKINIICPIDNLDLPECPICKDKIYKTDIYTTHCNHNYHNTCIKKWKEMGLSSCPVCRAQIN